MIDNKLIEILACPKCKNSVRLAEDKKYIICETCRLAYPIKQDIPVMLIDSAIPHNSNACEGKK